MSLIAIAGDMIVPSTKYNITEESRDYRFVSTLRIKSLAKEDFGEYVCVAKNTIGKNEAVIKIYGGQLTLSLKST